MSYIPPTPSLPIVSEDGKMAQEFLLWTQLVSSPILTGSGSPEGNIEADTTTLYMDTSGTAGSILYIKRDTDIGGDPTKGWILI